MDRKKNRMTDRQRYSVYKSNPIHIAYNGHCEVLVFNITQDLKLISHSIHNVNFCTITGPHTHSVGGPVLFCSLASVIVVCNTSRRHNVTHQAAARDGVPVVLCPVRLTP